MDDSRSDTFRLRRGSTGFHHLGAPPAPGTGPRACRTAWYAAARAAHGQVGDFAERRYPRNFHTATIDDRGGTHFALFHASCPLVAFVSGQHHWYTDEFRDPPAWAATLDAHGYTVLNASQLLSPLSESDTSDLSADEWQQIRYWKPETVGAVLFNSWD
ncbi:MULTISPECIES: hypothetical protein [unclassified Streptomyces]|uniref:hypothetical protein n=1 Tax=unclassified Streptomyces TaxID=2593676 RepID=UPI00278C890B|nr:MULTISPECIES: hypothetical protein [unclassified Streptomyces]